MWRLTAALAAAVTEGGGRMTRHDLVIEVLRDPQTYSSLFGNTSSHWPTTPSSGCSR